MNGILKIELNLYSSPCLHASCIYLTPNAGPFKKEMELAALLLSTQHN